MGAMSIHEAGGVVAAIPGATSLVRAPSTVAIVLAIVTVVAGFVAVRWAERRNEPIRPEPAPDAAGLVGDEPPAVVNVLTNDATLTAAGLRATVIDLAARGWLRILPPEVDDDLGRVRPAPGSAGSETLLPHERLVLQHVLARFTTDRAIPARYLAVDVRDRWWRRLDRLVGDEARRRGLIRRRWSPGQLAALLAIGVAAAVLWWSAFANGDDDVAVIDSVGRRVAAFLTLIAIVSLIVRVVRHATRGEQRHTDAGLEVTRGWLAVRRDLVAAGLGQVAPSAMPIGDRRLAYASAMCLAEGAATELPLAREDHFRAWSAVGGESRLVRVRYPARIGYGIHPVAAMVGGLVACFAGLFAYRWFASIARGESLDGLYERFPDQDWLITDIAIGAAVLCSVPILAGLWVAIAGAADALRTVERTGLVLRARRPAEVVALPRFLRRLLERDRFVVYLAVDDGSSGEVVAWRTTERNAVPQGATAVVKATPLLGYVRRAVPIAHRLPE
jgi:hypothetical protein